MGEIGFPRQEFLNDLKFWEIRSIIRGYNARHHSGWEQARLIAYNAAHCMGAKNAPTITNWLQFPWEKSHDDELNDDQVNEIRELIKKENENKE